MGLHDEIDPAIRRLAAGETLFAAGDETRGFFEVRTGRVRLMRFGADGRETALFTAGPGERFAEASLFAARYHCDAIALSDAVVACFPRAACLARLNDDAPARFDLTADLARQVMMLRSRLTLRDIRSARERVLAFLVAEAGDDGRTVAFGGSLREIASAIGLTPEAFYRTLARLESEGAIERKAGRIALISASVAPTWPAKAQMPSPYAGEQGREIKALSTKDIDDLTQGRGMGLAKAAELNRYPGPMHGLELAEPLKLSDEQRQALKAIMTRMSAEAKAVGEDLLGLERELDAGFVARTINGQRLRALTERIGVTQGALRAVHLAAHIETAAVLSSEQIAQYDLLRGYAGTPAGSGAHGLHNKH